MSSYRCTTNRSRPSPSPLHPSRAVAAQNGTDRGRTSSGAKRQSNSALGSGHMLSTQTTERPLAPEAARIRDGASGGSAGGVTSSQRSRSLRGDRPRKSKHLPSGGRKSTYRHVPHSQKPPHLVARRNARERRRVQAVNSAFTRLRKHVPFEPRHKRLSKVKTLRFAIDYINCLQAMIKEYDSRSAPPPGMTHLPSCERAYPLPTPCPASINNSSSSCNNISNRTRRSDLLLNSYQWAQTYCTNVADVTRVPGHHGYSCQFQDECRPPCLRKGGTSGGLAAGSGVRPVY